MQLKEEDLDIIYKCLVGSHAYGTNVEGSDKDYKMIYLQSPESILNYGYQEQVTFNKDSVAYELRRVIELCATGNPTMLELLFSPEDCIEYKHPVMDILLKERDKFLSKSCRWSFGGYAISQVERAEGLNKKMNWEKDRMIRKNPIDFCWVVLDENNNISTKKEYIKQGVYPLKDWLDYRNFEQTDVVLNKLNHTKEGYQLYYQDGGKGITVDGSNNLRTTETPIGIYPLCTVLYNPDVYSRHCKEYLEYEKWLQERNTQRYVDVEGHGQQIDGKNLLHCVRLLETGLEVAKLKTLNVRRQNADYLISIRKGKLDLKTIVDSCRSKISELDKVYEESSLPDKVNRGYFLALLPKIRKEYVKN